MINSVQFTLSRTGRLDWASASSPSLTNNLENLNKSTSIKKPIIKSIKKTLELLMGQATNKEQQQIKQIQELLQSTLKPAIHKRIVALSHALIKLSKKYDNTGEIDENLTVDEIEKELDKKVLEYSKCDKNYPMQGISYCSSAKKYRIRYGNLDTKIKDLETACQRIMDHCNDKYNTVNETQIQKTILRNNNCTLIEYHHNDNRYYDIRHIISLLRQSRITRSRKYKKFLHRIKIRFWHQNNYGGYVLRELITKKTVKYIIHESHSLTLSDLIRLFEIKIINDKLLTKEDINLNTIIRVFHMYRYISQKHFKTYRVDLYFPIFRLAIECDEHGHKDRDKKYEETAWSELSPLRSLQCAFGTRISRRAGPDPGLLLLHEFGRA